MADHHQSSEPRNFQTLIIMTSVGVVASNGLLLSPILADVSTSLGTDTISISYANSAYGGATAYSAFPLAPKIDRTDPRRACAFALAWSLAAMLESAAAPHWLALAGAQALAEIAAGIALPGSFVPATIIVTPGQEACPLGQVLIRWSLSLIVGAPASAFIAEATGCRISYLALAALAAATLLGTRKLPERSNQRTPGARTRTPFTPFHCPNVTRLLFVCLCFTMSFYGVYASDVRQPLSVSAGQAGLVALAYGIRFAAATSFNGIIDRFGARIAFPTALLANALTYVVMGYATAVSAMILTAASVWDVSAHLCLNMTVLLLSRTKPTELGAALGLNSATTYLGAILGTVIAGAIYAHAVFEALAGCAALPPLLAAMLLIFNDRRGARRRSAAAQPLGESITELFAPVTDGPVADHHGAALGQDQFDVAQAEAKHMIQPHGVADDLGWEAMARIGNRICCHPISFTCPSSWRQPRLPWQCRGNISDARLSYRVTCEPQFLPNVFSAWQVATIFRL
jgi:predicted MFS family arabinose efflux permease